MTCQGQKIQNTLNSFQVQYFNYLYFNYSNTDKKYRQSRHLSRW